MGEILKLAFRNILRRKRRSLLTGLGMCIGGFVLCFGMAYGDGIQRQLFTTMIAANTGHVTIAASGTGGEKGTIEETYHIASDWRSIIKHPERVEAILAERSDVRRVSRRVTLSGMLVGGGKTGFCALVGIEPAKEPDLLTKALPVDRGAVLDNDPGAVYISHTTAETYDVGVGDSLAAIVQTVDGSTNAMDFTVKGIFKESAPWMEFYSYINLRSAQELAMTGGGVTQLKVILDDPDAAVAAAGDLRKHGELRGLSVKDWREAGGFFAGIVANNRASFLLLWGVLFLVVAATVMNTMLMAVHERIREIGTMMAMGTSRRRIVGLFLAESALLGAMAAGSGVLLAAGLALWLGRVGIPAPIEAARYMFGGNSAHPHLTAANVLISISAVVAVAAAASLYPAVSASRLRPVEALAYV